MHLGSIGDRRRSVEAVLGLFFLQSVKQSRVGGHDNI